MSRLPGASVLLITLDTTRADHLEPYGARHVETPNLGRLARRGIVFEHAYAVSPITLVSHTSILSGLYPPQHGVRNNGIHYVPEGVETLAEILGRRGYRTGAFVSAAVLDRRYGLDRGFDHYDDDLSTGRERHPRMVPDRPAEAVVDAAHAWLDDLRPEEPYFLWAHFYDPHAPYSPPPPYRDHYRDDPYAGEIAYMDAEIGRLMSHPRLRGDAEPLTLILADHGESLGEHGEQTHAILAYDSTLHIPFLMRAPGGPSGVRVDTPVSQVDILPTVVDLLALPQPGARRRSPAAAQVAGTSLVPLIEGRRGPDPPAGRVRGLYSETYLPYYTYGWAKLRVWRQGSWKLIDAPRRELYDLRRDPRELVDLHPQQAGRAHDLGRDLEEFLAAFEDPEHEASLSLDSESIEKLRSLGYLAVGSAPRPTREQRPNPRDFIGLHTALERSRRLMQDALFDAAVGELRGVLAQDPNNLAALIELANALAGRSDLDDAVRAVERALALDPDYPRLYLLMAGLEARRGRHGQSLELVERALEIDPRAPEAWIQKAQTLARLGRQEESDGALAEARAAFGDHPRLLAVSARLTDLRRGDLATAEGRLLRALELDPFLTLAWRLLGQVQERQGRPEEAAKSYLEGLRHRPDDREGHARLGLLLARTTGGPVAAAHLQEAIRLGDELDVLEVDLHVALGGWLAENGRLAEALDRYRRVLEVEPGHPGARNNLAVALFQLGRLEEAAAELEALVAERPRLADPHNNLSALAIERRDWATAEHHARRALALGADTAPVWNNLGIAVEEQGGAEAAEAAYRRSLEIDPEYWQARLNFGILRARQGQPAEAAELLEGVIRRVPSQAEAHRELGELYAGPLADPRRARNHLNALLRHAADHPDAPDIARRLTELRPCRGSAPDS